MREIHKDWKTQDVAFVFVLAMLFFLLVDLAAEQTFYLFELSFLLLSLWMLWDFTKNFKQRVALMRSYFSGNTAPLLWAVLAYLLVDLLNSLYASNMENILQKYRVVITTGILGLSIVLYGDTENKLQRVKKTVISAGLLMAVIAVGSYVFLPSLPQHYILRLSLRRDYNVFASVIGIAYCFGVFYVWKKRLPFLQKMLLVGAISMVSVPMIFLSASRRGVLLACFLLASTLFLWIGEWYQHRKKVVAIVASVGILLMASATIYFQTAGLQGYMEYLYHTPQSPHAPRGGAGGEMMALDRIQTTVQAGAMEKRRLIWGIAWNEFSHYQGRERWIGRGNAYDLELFQRVRHVELEKAYGGRETFLGNMSAHSFLLADLLNGGVGKALVGLVLVAMIGRTLLLEMLRDPIATAPYALMLTFCIAGDFISNRFGLLYDKLLILTLAIFVREILNRRENHEIRLYHHFRTPTR